ncbi:MAG: polysaccharide deacetylase family protein [Betaproteobacteria bacterium]|nr:polysaccharide deacetylase family protein [Betaproteobacteria bacterium]
MTKAQIPFGLANVCFICVSLVILVGCAGVAPSVLPGKPGVIRGEEYVVHTAEPGDTWAALAGTYLKDKGKGWLIADFNKTGEIVPGQQIVVPLVHPNPVGVFSSGYQTVTILCYHRFGQSKSKMTITPEDFDAQMAYLRKNGYRVIPLASIHAFLRGEAPLPQRAVVITVDDGYRSSYDLAYPILRKYNFPATLFIYTDFIGSKDALGWNEIRGMAGSGLIDIQPHSKTHASMTRRLPNESTEAYRKRVEDEIRTPGQQIRRMLGLPLHTFAYPFGDTDEFLISQLKNAGYRAGVTVQVGGNPAFAYPFRLRRTMIFGDRDMAAFVKSLRVYTAENLK